MKNPHWFQNYSVSRKAGVLPFLHTILHVSQQPFDIPGIQIIHMKLRQNTYQNHYGFV